MDLLQAYETVLKGRGIDPARDAHHYRLLLQLSLDPQAAWWTGASPSGHEQQQGRSDTRFLFKF